LLCGLKDRKRYFRTFAGLLSHQPVSFYVVYLIEIGLASQSTLAIVTSEHKSLLVVNLRCWFFFGETGCFLCSEISCNKTRQMSSRFLYFMGVTHHLDFLRRYEDDPWPWHLPNPDDGLEEELEIIWGAWAVSFHLLSSENELKTSIKHQIMINVMWCFYEVLYITPPVDTQIYCQCID